MIVAGAFVAVILGGLAGLGLNRLAAWLLARDEDASAPLPPQSWGEVRAPLPQSWGEARAPLPQSWGEARAPLPQSWGEARAPLPQSWGEARAPLPQSWGEVRVPLPQSWGEARAPLPQLLGEARSPQSWGAGGGVSGPGHSTRARELALVAATALLAAALWLRYGASWQLLPAAIGGLLLLLIAAIDLDRRLVLNEVVLVGVALSILHAGLVGGWGGLLIALAGGGVGFGLFLLVAGLGRLVSGTAALGAGDIKLAGLLGLMFGFPAVIRCLLLGVICGGLVSGGLLVARRLDRKALIPYAPFLVAGGIITLLMY